VWPVEWIVVGAAVVLTVFTGIDYLVKARRAARTAD
jgi:CDP-diacylglycerol--glycerol-3-phosphate 3-phosphatidyltransferase